MIIYPGALVLTATALLGQPLGHPRIFYQTWLRGLAAGAVSVSGENAGFPADAPLREDTAEQWQPPTLPAYWQVDLGVARMVDYLAIGAHDIGSKGAAVEVRWSADEADFESYVSVPGNTSNIVSTPDTAGNSVTGDIDVRVRVALADWTPAAIAGVARKWEASGNQRSWDLCIKTDGKLEAHTTADGSTIRTATSSVAPTVTDGAALWLRFTRASASGDVIFYTSSDYDPDTGTGSWAQLGTTVSTTAEGIFNSTSAVKLGISGSGGDFVMVGRVLGFELRNGIGGVRVARFRPDDGANGATSVTSSETGEVWTINQSGAPAALLVMKRFAEGVAPADDAALVFMDAPRTVKHLRVGLKGGAVPKIGVIYAGEQLAMPRSMEPGFRPLNLNRETVLAQMMSRGGQFLGQAFRRLGIKSSVSFGLIDATWYRAHFDPFVKEARKYPYFFAWQPEAYPEEVGLVWTGEDFAPSHPAFDFVRIEWNMRGRGHE